MSFRTSLRMTRSTFTLAALTVASLAAWADQAFAVDQGYRYDKRLGRCVNVQGLTGFNMGHKGECGDLWGEDLKADELSRANLTGANLARGDLTGVDLRGADLRGANLLLTKLKDADLQGAIYNERTLLPFDRKEAERRGMIFQSSKSEAQADAGIGTPPKAGRITIRRN